jgi:hypothetical protein
MNEPATIAGVPLIIRGYDMVVPGCPVTLQCQLPQGTNYAPILGALYTRSSVRCRLGDIPEIDVTVEGIAVGRDCNLEVTIARVESPAR